MRRCMQTPDLERNMSSYTTTFVPIYSIYCILLMWAHSMSPTVLLKILLSCTECLQLSHSPSPPPPCSFPYPLPSFLPPVEVCEQWVNEEHFAAWADGEHWSACWQVAYSLLSELALSNARWGTRGVKKTTTTHTYAQTLQQLWGLIGT